MVYMCVGKWHFVRTTTIFFFLKYSSFNKTFNNTDSLSPRQNLVALELGLVAGDACTRKVASPEAAVFA